MMVVAGTVAASVRAAARSLGLQVILLWLTGQGPSFAGSGQVVPLDTGTLFAATVVMVVATSILAILFQQFERESRPFRTGTGRRFRRFSRSSALRSIVSNLTKTTPGDATRVTSPGVSLAFG
ncbi:MAG: hypothetical protein R2845_11350 [Thermomicrobiales bacterium]